MNKLHRFYILLIVLQLIIPAPGAICQSQVGDTSSLRVSEKVYVLQVAASKKYIDPEFLKKKFNLSENVRYFLKDGWYKYIIGSYKTEAEATASMAKLNLKAFVTSVQEKAVPVEEKTLSKPVHIPKDDSLSPGLKVEELRQKYQQTIREADSSFNMAKNLLLARRLYEYASFLAPDKSYPKDQVVEIDKQLMQKQSKSVFSKLPLVAYIVAGFAVILILVLYIPMKIRKKRQGPDYTQSEESLLFTDNQEPVTEFRFEGADNEDIEAPVSVTPTKNNHLIDEIMQLYPGLRKEIVNKLGDSPLDYGSVLDETERCLNSFNIVLRMEAELAWIHLCIDDPFAFLYLLKQDFTPWEQLHVFEMLKRNRISFPDFSTWLDSTNETVVLFCRRMMGDDGTNERLWRSDEDLQSIALKILKDRIGQRPPD